MEGSAQATLSPESMINTDLSTAGIFYPANSGNFVNMRTALMNPPWPVASPNTFTVGGPTNAQFTVTPGTTTSNSAQITTNSTAPVQLLGRLLIGSGFFNLAVSAEQHLFDAVSTTSGSYNAGGAFTNWNRIGDLSDATSITSTQATAGLYVAETTAAGAAGDRASLHADLTIPVTMGAGGGNSQHTVGIFTGQITANQGGSAPNSGLSVGSLFGVNPNVIARSGATDLSGVIGEEIDVAVASGASTQEKIGLQVVQTSADGVQAGDLDSDTAIRAVNQNGSPGWQQVYDIGGYLANWPVASGGTLLRARPTNGTALGSKSFQPPPPLAGIGIDFGKVQFTTASLLMPGWKLDGSGSMFANSAKLSTSSATTTLDVNGSVLTGVAIATAGTNYFANDLVQTADGSIVKITSVSSGVPTAVSIIVPGYSASPPSNPVATLNGSGSGLTLTDTWTTATTLGIGTSNATTINIGNSGSTTSIAGTIKAGSSTGISQTCTVNQAKTLIFTNGILTGGSCNS